MERRLDTALDAALDLGNKGKRYIVENAGKTVAALTAIVATVLTFLDVALPDLSLRAITTEVVIMLVSSAIIYISLDESGVMAGKGTEVFTAAKSAYDEVRGRITGDMIEPLRDFCLEYSRAALEYRRREALVSEAVSEEEYLRYKRGEDFDRSHLKLFRRIDAMREAPINPRDLVEGERSGGGESIRNPERRKPLWLILKLVPILLSTLLTVSMIITAKEGLDLSTVLSGIVKLACLPIVALRGYVGGYAYATETLAPWYDRRREILNSFLDREEA